MTHIGKRILERRTMLNMSQEELAKMVGYKDRSSIARIEAGERDVRQNKIIAFSAALRTTPAWLMGYDEKTAPGGHTGSESEDIAALLETARPRSEWLEIIGQLSRENKLKLLEYARLLLLSQAQDRPEGQE